MVAAELSFNDIDYRIATNEARDLKVQYLP
jgi:hypothetical protein